MTKPAVHGPPGELIIEKMATDFNEPPALAQKDDSTSVQETVQIQKPEKARLKSPRSVCNSIHLSSPSKLSIQACCAPTAQVIPRKMGISKSNRIIILLVIDSAFFLLELIVGKDISLLSLLARY